MLCWSKPVAVGARMVLAGMVVMFCVFSFFGDAVAGGYFKWTDDVGHVHFTDNAMKVPEKYRKKSVHALDKSDSINVLKDAVVVSSSGRSIGGEKLWATKCADCHHLGFGRKERLRGLGHLVIDSATKFPLKVEQIVPKLKYGTEGNTSIMDPIELSDNELRAIAKFIRDSR